MAGIYMMLTNWGRGMHKNSPTLVQIMAYCLLDFKPLSEPMLVYVNWDLRNKRQWHSNRNSNIFIQENAFKNVWKMAAILSWLVLSHWHLVVPYGIIELGQHWIRQWFVASLVPGDQNKMAAMMQTTISNAFFQWKFLLLRVWLQLTRSWYCFR